MGLPKTSWTLMGLARIRIRILNLTVKIACTPPAPSAGGDGGVPMISNHVFGPGQVITIFSSAG